MDTQETPKEIIIEEDDLNKTNDLEPENQQGKETKEMGIASEESIENEDIKKPLKIDRRKETSKLNIAKARATKLRKQKERQEKMEALFGDSDSDTNSSESESESDSEDDMQFNKLKRKQKDK